MEIDETIRAMRAEGVPVAALAEQIGKSKRFVEKRIKALGIATGTTAKVWTREDDERHLEMLALSDAGRGYGEIASRLGMTRNQVAGLIRRIRAEEVECS